MTSRVQVDVPGSRPPAMSAMPGAPPDDRKKVEISLNDKVELVADKTSYDQATKELLMPIRLKNVSNEAIYKPIIRLFDGAARPGIPRTQRADRNYRLALQDDRPTAYARYAFEHNRHGEALIVTRHRSIRI
jgi:hypothetical protein